MTENEQNRGIERWSKEIRQEKVGENKGLNDLSGRRTSRSKSKVKLKSQQTCVNERFLGEFDPRTWKFSIQYLLKCKNAILCKRRKSIPEILFCFSTIKARSRLMQIKFRRNATDDG